MAWEMLRTGTTFSQDLFWYIVHEKLKLVYQKKKNKLYVIFSRYYLALWGQEEIVFIFWSNQTKLKNYPETIYSTSTRSIPSGEKSFYCKWPYTTNGRFLQVAKFLTNRNVNLEGGTYITKAIKGFRLPSDRFGGL